MPVVACPCGKKFRAIDALAGKQVNCPGCGRPLLIPHVSLLDEELARPSVAAPSADPLPRSRIHDRSVKMEGGLLAVLLVGGGLVVLAIVATMMSMLAREDGPAPAGHLASKTTTSPPAAEGQAGNASPDSAEPLETLQPELESTVQETAPVPTADSSKTAGSAAVEEPPVAKPVPQVTEPKGNAAPPPPDRPTGATSQTSSDTIRLSAGVALPQSLPTGTAMGFSVDYEFVRHPPTGPANFFWVIESGKGQAVRQPVQMTARGTLQGFVTQFRPEHAPFSTHIEDQSGNRLSKSLPLR